MNKSINIHFNHIAATFITFIVFCGIIFNGCSQSTIVSTTPKATVAETEIISSESATTEYTGETETVPETTTQLNYDELIDFDAKHPYMIRINRAQNWTTIYGLDKNGHYSVPYKIFTCSTGLHEGDTPLGSYTLGQKYDWRLMVDGSYAQYAIRIHGPIMLHSVPYYSQNKNDLEVKEYNKLGQSASLGCIRYTVADIKWIYDNCPDGTIVVIYDSENEIPLLKIPDIIPAKAKGPKAGWDPTDPDKSNPWNKKIKNNKAFKTKKSQDNDSKA